MVHGDMCGDGFSRLLCATFNKNTYLYLDIFNTIDSVWCIAVEDILGHIKQEDAKETEMYTAYVIVDHMTYVSNIVQGSIDLWDDYNMV